MFGISWSEMLVVGLVALIVVGPDKLPEMARTIGKFYHQLKQAATEASQTFSAEVELLNTEASKVVDGLGQALPKAVIGQSELEDLKKAVDPQSFVGPSELEDLKKAVDPQSLFAEGQTGPAAETPAPAVPSAHQPQEPSSPSSPVPAEVTKDA